MEDLGNVYQTIIILVGVLGTLLTLKKYLTDIAKEFKKPFDDLRTEMKNEIAVLDKKLEALDEEIKAIKKDDMNEREGIMSGLRFAILRLCDICYDKGFATLAEREQFEAMYVKYRDMGGNGVIEAEHAKFLQLPDKKPVKRTTKKTRSA